MDLLFTLSASPSAFNLEHPHPFPMIRAGGIFLLCIGIFLALGAFKRRWMVPLLVVGFAAAMLSQAVIVLAAPHLLTAFGQPSDFQIVALLAAFILMGVLFGVLGAVMGEQGFRRSRQWMWVLLIVGAHLLAISPAHGWVMAGVGLTVALLAGAALTFSYLPVRPLWFATGLVQVLGGLVMVLVFPA